MRQKRRRLHTLPWAALRSGAHPDLFPLLLSGCLECAAVPEHGMHDDRQPAGERHAAGPHTWRYRNGQ